MQQLPQFLTPALTQLPSSGQQAPALPILNSPNSTFDLAFNNTPRRRKWTGRTAQQAVRAESREGQQVRDQITLMHMEVMDKRIEALERKCVEATIHSISFSLTLAAD